MRRMILGLLMWALAGFPPEEVSGQGGAGAKESSRSFPASLHLIHEPGVGTPGEQEIFTAVRTDGFLSAAKKKAMDDVRFEARNKGLNYEIIGMKEENMEFGYRVIVQYRLRSPVVEIATPETIWWQEWLKKIQNYLPYLKKVLAEAERFVDSSWSESQKTEEAAIP